jgi:hypothetical protein
LARSTRSRKRFRYDVCLSFASENRPYVKQVADELTSLGVRVFYDTYEDAALWGKDLYTHLDDIYANAARFCVLFASAAYARKVWTNHERAAAQARAIEQHAEYILPARFDDTKIPGLRSTIGYIDLRKVSPHQLAQKIAAKLGKSERSNYLPPMPDLLFSAVAEIDGSVDPVVVFDRATHFLEALLRTEDDERELLIQVFYGSCPADLPRNVHVNINHVTRTTGFATSKILRLLSNLRSLGFYSRTRHQRPSKRHLGEDHIVVVEWHDMSTEPTVYGNATGVAYAMMQVACFARCPDCGLRGLRRLDFSHLSSSMVQAELHDFDRGKPVMNVARAIRDAFPVRFQQTPATIKNRR